MNLLDIISLTKAGYKKKDIDDLLKLELEPAEPDEPETENEPEEVSQDQPEESGTESEMPETVTVESLQKKIEKLEVDLKQAQKQNREKGEELDHNQPDETQKRLEALARSYM